MRCQAACFDALRDYLETVPLVDCHDHTGSCGPRYTDPLQVVVAGYFVSDLMSAVPADLIQEFLDEKRPLEERWSLFEPVWKRTCHTGYAQVIRRVLSYFYNEKSLTLDALQRMQSHLPNLEDADTFDTMLQDAGILVRLIDSDPNVASVLDATYQLPPRGRLVISLPQYHNITSCADVQSRVAPTGRIVTSLGEYLAACREMFAGMKRHGCVAFKDQSAYTRSLDYGNPTRAEAEEIFNWFMADPRRSMGYPEAVKPLDDYLFHEFLRTARDLDLPVQIHTGHMAGIRNDIVKTNAVHLIPVLELHPDVRFDLFHANWPYSGEILFLAKNYPNVAIDFCWANIIDPIYCQRMFQQALSSVPHAKIHGYGSDFFGLADHAWAHAAIARDNIAIALAELVDAEYLGLDDAKEVAYGWLFGNANEFFRLGLSATTLAGVGENKPVAGKIDTAFVS